MSRLMDTVMHTGVSVGGFAISLVEFLLEFGTDEDVPFSREGILLIEAPAVINLALQ